MKLRCVENSLRLRLRKSEVEELARNKSIKVEIGFPSGSLLAYELRIFPSSPISALFDSGLISIRLPEQQAMEWIQSEQVGISQEIDLPDGKQLSILIEKDFPCKDRPEEDKADTFEELAAKEEKDAC